MFEKALPYLYCSLPAFRRQMLVGTYLATLCLEIVMKETPEKFTDEEFDDEDEEDTLEGRYLIFSIEERNYGIEILHITEIVGLQTITEVPDMPTFVKGVINLRGKIIPLIDMRIRFKLPETQYNDKTCVIIVSIQSQFVGLIVDTVREVLRISPEQLEEAPRMNHSTGGSKLVKALAKIKDEVKVLLAVEKLFTEDEIPTFEPQEEGLTETNTIKEGEFQ
jgi:purine-binding chemotaxis protein CheW